MIVRRAWPAAIALVAATCGGWLDPDAPTNVAAQVSSAISTVVHVQWKTTEASVGYVEYGPTEAMEMKTPVETTPATDHSASLLGLTADTVIYYRVVAVDGTTTHKGATATIRTGDLPVGVPALTRVGDGHDRFTVVPVLGNTTAVTIINADGKIVWYHTDDRDLQFYRARLSVDGKSLLYNAASVSGAPSDESELVRVALDGSATSSIAVPLLAHDFVEHADGTLAAIVVEYRDFEGTQLRGDKIVEIDARRRRRRTVWSAWDCFDPAVVDRRRPRARLDLRERARLRPGRGRLLPGHAQLQQHRARSTAQTRRVRMGARPERRDASTSRRAPRASCTSTSFRCAAIASSSWTTTAVLGTSRACSSTSSTSTAKPGHAGLELRRRIPSVYTFVLGEPTRFDDGSTFINWSAAGQLERVDPEGDLALEAEHGRRVRLRLPHAGGESLRSARVDAVNR